MIAAAAIWNVQSATVIVPAAIVLFVPELSTSRRGLAGDSARGLDDAMTRLAATVLLFTCVGPLIGSASHAVLLALFEPWALPGEGLSLVPSIVALSYAMGLVPALIVGTAVAWRSRRRSGATLAFALAFAVVAPILTVVLLGFAWKIGSGGVLVEADTVWRGRQLQDAATMVSLLTLHSVAATTGCWFLARSRRLV